MLPSSNTIKKKGIRRQPVYLFVFLLLTISWMGGAPPANAGNALIKGYQTFISPADGDRCPMYPSCSAYAEQAIKKHGLILGWVLTCDRLVRCGRDETKLGKKVRIDNRVKTLDTVESNDFWWFSDKKNQ